MTVPAITAQEAQQWLNSAEPPRLIDVREQEEWDHCRIEGAELLPLSRFGELAQAQLQDPSQKLLIYCHHGMRSAQVVSFLLRSGFTDVTNLAGGIEAWSVDVDPGVPRY